LSFVPTSHPSQVRLADLVATMSLLCDLGMGRPMERVLRQTVIALRLADAAGVEPEERPATYYISLLTWVGCATDTSDLAQLFGDETKLYADTHDEDLAGMTMAMFIARHLGDGSSSLRRFGMVGRFFITGGRSVQKVMMAHCQSASALADQLQLGEDVSIPLLQAFERWDGRGVPGQVGGAELARALRIVHLADNLEAFLMAGGREAALTVARQRRGTQFDPELVDVVLSHPDQVLGDIESISAWDEVIALDPRLGARMTDDELDQALEGFADFSDLKSPTRTGHSRAVAALVTAAAEQLGLAADESAQLRRAALVQDIGMIGIPSGVWDAPRPWTLAEQERARTHPYLTERMLARTSGLADVARLASQGHERLDGTGYPRGLVGAAIPMPARILAAADVFAALREPRPHRPEVDADRAAEVLRDEAKAGRLDGAAVNAVLAAAGRPIRRRAVAPSGLTNREVDVLVQLALGRSNAEIASALSVSRKTVSTHLEHVYAKLGVSTRTAAALFAMRQGLVPNIG
jgi:HD-GYP domain-containing protein (c-di-GMP phosphodiesterase class II)/DNA-binding CsgD family transcriptional regulator